MFSSGLSCIPLVVCGRHGDWIGLVGSMRVATAISEYTTLGLLLSVYPTFVGAYRQLGCGARDRWTLPVMDHGAEVRPATRISHPSITLPRSGPPLTGPFRGRHLRRFAVQFPSTTQDVPAFEPTVLRRFRGDTDAIPNNQSASFLLLRSKWLVLKPMTRDRPGGLHLPCKNARRIKSVIRSRRFIFGSEPPR